MRPYDKADKVQQRAARRLVLEAIGEDRTIDEFAPKALDLAEDVATIALEVPEEDRRWTTRVKLLEHRATLARMALEGAFYGPISRGNGLVVVSAKPDFDAIFDAERKLETFATGDLAELRAENARLRAELENEKTFNARERNGG